MSDLKEFNKAKKRLTEESRDSRGYDKYITFMFADHNIKATINYICRDKTSISQFSLAYMNQTSLDHTIEIFTKYMDKYDIDDPEVAYQRTPNDYSTQENIKMSLKEIYNTDNDHFVLDNNRDVINLAIAEAFSGKRDIDGNHPNKMYEDRKDVFALVVEDLNVYDLVLKLVINDKGFKSYIKKNYSDVYDELLTMMFIFEASMYMREDVYDFVKVESINDIEEYNGKDISNIDDEQIKHTLVNLQNELKINYLPGILNKVDYKYELVDNYINKRKSEKRDELRNRMRNVDDKIKKYI